MKCEFVLYVADNEFCENKRAIARVIVADSDIEFFEKNKIASKTKERAFTEFVVKHIKKEAPHLFEHIDENLYFYLEHPIFALRKKEKIDHLEIIDLTC
jgi:hypothetical protein